MSECFPHYYSFVVMHTTLNVETEFRCCELIQQRIGESTRTQPMWPGFDSSLSGWACWPSSSLAPRAFPLKREGKKRDPENEIGSFKFSASKDFFLMLLLLFCISFFSVSFYPGKS